MTEATSACDVIENEPLAGNGQTELDRILCELDKDIILLDQTLNASTTSTIGMFGVVQVCCLVLGVIILPLLWYW